MTVSDKTIQAESLGDFLKNLHKEGTNILKEMVRNGQCLYFEYKIRGFTPNKNSYCAS